MAGWEGVIAAGRMRMTSAGDSLCYKLLTLLSNGIALLCNVSKLSYDKEMVGWELEGVIAAGQMSMTSGNHTMGRRPSLLRNAHPLNGNTDFTMRYVSNLGYNTEMTGGKVYSQMHERGRPSLLQIAHHLHSIPIYNAMCPS